MQLSCNRLFVCVARWQVLLALGREVDSVVALSLVASAAVIALALGSKLCKLRGCVSPLLLMLLLR